MPAFPFLSVRILIKARLAQLRLLGLSHQFCFLCCPETDVRLGIVAQLLTRKTQGDGDDKRCFVKAQFGDESIVPSPNAAGRRRLLRQQAPGGPSLLPQPVTAGDPLLDAIAAHDQRDCAIPFRRLPEVIASSFRLLVGKRNFLPNTFAAEPEPSGSRSDSPFSLRFEFLPRRLVGRQRFRLHARQKFIPDEVEDGLHVLEAASDGQHGILVGKDDAVLPKRSVAAIGPMAAAPELVTVALIPVALRVATVGGLPGSRGLDPFLGHELFPQPLALLQIELAETGDVLGADTQAIAAGRYALRTVSQVGFSMPRGSNRRGRR